MSEQVSMLVQEYSDDHLYQLLPETYRLSREVEEIKKIWQPLLEQELGPSINQIRDGTRTLFEGRSRLKGIVSRVERDERAQTVLQDFVKGKLPLPELRQLLQQLKEPVTPPPHPASSNEVRGRLNMAPPDNQSAVAIGTNGAPQTGASFVPDSFMTPRRPENGHSAVDSAARPSTVGRQDADTPTRQRGSISMALSPPNTVTTGVKRSLNTALAGDDHQSPESPSTSMSALNKRQRIALSGANRTPVRPPNTGSSAVTEVTRAVTFAEVCEEEFIFTDARCGPGWYVIRCNTNSRGFDNAPARFQRHPFDNDLALRHFNSKEVDCHDSRGKYTVEDIIRECAYRVYANIVERDEPTEAEVITSNTVLDGKPDKLPVTPVAATPARKVGRPRKKAKDSIANALPQVVSDNSIGGHNNGRQIVAASSSFDDTWDFFPSTRDNESFPEVSSMSFFAEQALARASVTES